MSIASQLKEPAPDNMSSFANSLDITQKIIRQQLHPIVRDIDEKAFYPKQVMKSFGEAGVFKQHLKSQNPTGKAELFDAITLMDAVSSECLSTGFMVWCQNVCGWYIQNSENSYLHENLLAKVATAEYLGGTGLSNPMKHFSEIEKLLLRCEVSSEGYVLNGTLPWVSNLGADHYFGIVCEIEKPVSRKAMILVPCESEGLTLKEVPSFMAMDGTATYSCRFDNVVIPESYVLADPIPKVLTYEYSWPDRDPT